MHLLRTLGSATVFQPAESGVRPVVLPAKRLALLIFLARGSRNPLIRRDLLLALLWPELDQAHGRGALRQSLSGIRKQLGPDVLVTQGEEEVGLAPGLVICDAAEFERACGQGEAEAALALYQGDFLSGFHATDLAAEFEQWVDEERTRLRRLAVTAAWSGAEAAERAGRNAEALSFARRAVALAPEDEAGVARLIGLLDGHGDRSGALAVYDQLVRRLADEFAVDPSPETRALVARVRARRSAPTASPVPADGTVAGANTDPPAERAVAQDSSESVERRDTPWRRLMLPAALGAAVMLAFAGVSAWIRPASRTANDLVAIAPFRVSAADSSVRWLQEGIVELLAIRLAGDGGLQVAEPGRLLEAWHRTVGSGRADVAELAVHRLAQGLGAGRTIFGSVTGTPASLELNAWFLARDGRTLGRASVTGPVDSLAPLIDRLAAELLGVNAGIQTHELASLVSTSLPATRAFLAGRAAARAGRLERAARLFEQALDLDTTSALAGFELCRLSAWTPANEARGCTIAERGRNQLNPADRALLDVRDGQWISAPAMFGLWNQVVTAYPDRPDSWYGLGDSYYHWGSLAGIEDFATRAEDAFRRGWTLDSITNGSLPGPFISEPIRHLVELAQMRHDTATVLRLVERVLAVDSTSDLARTLTWHRAQVEPEKARRAFWEQVDARVSEPTTRNILTFATWTGIGAADLPRATEEELRRLRAHDNGALYLWLRDAASNGGRPAEVPWMDAARGWLPREALRSRLRQGMSWNGDTLAALAAARQLKPLGAEAPLDLTEYRAQLQDLCTLTQWQVHQGVLTGVESAVRRLRAARAPTLTGSAYYGFLQVQELCAALLEAARASALGRPDTPDLIERADSLARTNISEVCCGEAVNDANVLLARLWERVNEPRRALQAVKRRAGGFMIEPLYLSTFLREEGRLSALLGDTAGAVRAYRHYLALRYNPEPSVRPEVERVRVQLAALEPARR